MPYIKPERRKLLDPILLQLFRQLDRIEDGLVIRHTTLDEMKGDVNYCFTKILVSMVARFGKKYAVLSNIKAIPQDVLDEFQAVVMRPYEDKKRDENGVVDSLV